MTASSRLSYIRHQIKQQAVKCQSSFPIVSAAPWVDSILSRARQVPFICCLALYLLFVCSSLLFSSIQFTSALHANTLSRESLVAESGLAKNVDPSINESTLWAPPSPVLIPGSPNAEVETIPKIIHRMWRGPASEIPEEWSNATKSCQEQNPSYQQYLWTDKTAHEFIETHFGWFLSTYTSHLLPHQQIDALRYFLVWHYGGIYIDPEVGCQRPMNPLVNGTAALLLRSWPYGVSNKLVASTPSHPFIIKVALSIHDHHVSFVPATVTAFFRSGSILISRILAAWLRSTGDESGVAILSPALFEATGDSFFVSYEGARARGDEVAVSEHVFGNLIGWCGAGIALVIMATVAFGLERKSRRGHRESVAISV
ncbi:mannosyl phosphorylinositol ceramide synthase SUR1 [Penicillium paradoxum]|uniref:mannosyl phosphorylinositol ceramide synthase SUR1 n=1 Tax=Penicillium paradoxum TaxID=176176 RepID=UPI00254829D1|nr:mannosyl phosphorylinositol ceramide synthase SUR1 [Penicillium paradoxum]KAJ5779813.1 mannosyl phosphorylinositol ceramide synthase SUR1 [Penicillium paradoxum]